MIQLQHQSTTTPEFTPELKAKWVAALRSKDYRQGFGYLRNPNGDFCCLGVLYDVAGGEWKQVYPGGCYRIAESDTGSLLLNPDGWMFIDWGTQSRLADLNDAGRSFEDIANYIEENL